MKWIIICISSIVFFLDYILKYLPVSAKSMIIQQFSLDNAQFGWFLATYAYPYSVMQIFVGIIVDTKGVYYTSLLSTGLCTLGALIMSHHHSFGFLILGRFIIGIGASFCISNGYKLVSVYIQKKYQTLIANIFVSFGLSGAIFGINLTSYLITIFSWPVILCSISLICAIILFTQHYIMNDHKYIARSTSKEIKIPITTSLKYACNTNFIRKSIFSGLIFSVAILLSMWSNEFLAIQNNISIEQANYTLSVMLTGFIISNPLSGYFVVYFNEQKHHNLMMYFSCFIFLILMYILITYHLSYHMLMYIMFSIGLLHGPSMVAFSLAKNALPVHMSGSAAGFTNFINTILEAISISLVGMIPKYMHYPMNSAAPIIFCMILVIISIFVWPKRQYSNENCI